MIKAYKTFSKDLTCRGFQYEVGGVYQIPRGSVLEMCVNGFHACRILLDCFSYYPWGPFTRVCEVEL